MRISAFFVFLLMIHFTFGQINMQKQSILDTDTSFNKKRFKHLAITTVGSVAGMYTILGSAWYSGVPKSKFHFFDDSFEWKQMDKVGHMLGAYQESRGMIQALKWTGMSQKKAAIIGGLSGFFIQTPIEIFDGYSQKWGASVSDIAANASGSLIAITNEMLWQEQRIQLKYSFHFTSYASQAPDKLGSGLDQILKDYNGQTYWASIRVHSFLPESKFKEKYPNFLNLAVGYGADGLLGGYGIEPQSVINAREFRQYYLSLDLDLAQIKTKSKALDMILGILNFFKFPAPAIEFNKDGVKLHPFYF